LSEFYVHKQMGDGHLNKCKECTKVDVNLRENHLRKTDKSFVSQERIRGREKYARLNYREAYGKTKEVKEKIIGDYFSKFPEKEAAHKAASKIKCPSQHHKHHWSYNTEHLKDVVMLPYQLHYKTHRYMTYSQKEKMYRTLEGTLLDTRERHEAYIKLVSELF